MEQHITAALGAAGQGSAAAALCAVFVIAGCVKGVTGMGLPTVAVSLLGLWMPPLQAAALLVLPSLLTNLAQCCGPHWRAVMRLLWPALLGLVVTILAMPAAGGASLPVDSRLLLGVVLVAYGLWGLWRPELPRLSAQRRWPGLLAGAITGAVTAVTSVFVIPMVPWLQALRLPKDVMVQALGLSFTVATLALAARLRAVDGPSCWSVEAAVALVAASIGLWLGSRLRGRISAAVFQRALFLVFVMLGAANLLRAG